MTKARTKTSTQVYGGQLTKPLPRMLGNRLDPEKKPDEFMGSALQWRERVLALRKRENDAFTDAFRELVNHYGLAADFQSEGEVEISQRLLSQLAFELMVQHVPAFQSAYPDWKREKAIAQSGNTGAKSAISGMDALAIAYLPRFLPAGTDVADRAHAMLAAQHTRNPVLAQKNGKRNSSPDKKTVRRYLDSIASAFDAVLNGTATDAQCEYVELVYPLLHPVEPLNAMLRDIGTN